jgi:hypothetical protein
MIVDENKVVLGKRAIVGPKQEGFELHVEPLIGFVREAFCQITANDLSLAWPS